jgi:hypothetical protein
MGRCLHDENVESFMILIFTLSRKKQLSALSSFNLALCNLAKDWTRSCALQLGLDKKTSHQKIKNMPKNSLESDQN